MNRGDRRESIFHDDADRQRFIETLGEACGKTGWQVHAYCLMPNHFHLVLETPQPNLVAGMKWFLGTYTSRFNRRHKLFGHLFSGRYKAMIVDSATPGYLKTACDYVHLNPVRARLLRPEAVLRSYRWSSYGEYLRRLAAAGVAASGPAVGRARRSERQRGRGGACLDNGWRNGNGSRAGREAGRRGGAVGVWGRWHFGRSCWRRSAGRGARTTTARGCRRAG